MEGPSGLFRTLVISLVSGVTLAATEAAFALSQVHVLQTMTRSQYFSALFSVRPSLGKKQKGASVVVIVVINVMDGDGDGPCRVSCRVCYAQSPHLKDKVFLFFLIPMIYSCSSSVSSLSLFFSLCHSLSLSSSFFLSTIFWFLFLPVSISH